MKSPSAGTVSGCLIWFIVFAIATICLLPVAMAVGGFTSGTDFAGRIVGGIECPKGTTPKINSYATTSLDDNGIEQPATGYELTRWHSLLFGSGSLRSSGWPLRYSWHSRWPRLQAF